MITRVNGLHLTCDVFSTALSRDQSHHTLGSDRSTRLENSIHLRTEQTTGMEADPVDIHKGQDRAGNEAGQRSSLQGPFNCQE